MSDYRPLLGHHSEGVAPVACPSDIFKTSRWRLNRAGSCRSGLVDSSSSETGSHSGESEHNYTHRSVKPPWRDTTTWRPRSATIATTQAPLALTERKCSSTTEHMRYAKSTGCNDDDLNTPGLLSSLSSLAAHRYGSKETTPSNASGLQLSLSSSASAHSRDSPSSISESALDRKREVIKIWRQDSQSGGGQDLDQASSVLGLDKVEPHIDYPYSKSLQELDVSPEKSHTATSCAGGERQGQAHGNLLGYMSASGSAGLSGDPNGSSTCYPVFSGAGGAGNDGGQPPQKPPQVTPSASSKAAKKRFPCPLGASCTTEMKEFVSQHRRHFATRHTFWYCDHCFEHFDSVEDSRTHTSLEHFDSAEDFRDHASSGAPVCVRKCVTRSCCNYRSALVKTGATKCDHGNNKHPNAQDQIWEYLHNEVNLPAGQDLRGISQQSRLQTRNRGMIGGQESPGDLTSASAPSIGERSSSHTNRTSPAAFNDKVWQLACKLEAQLKLGLPSRVHEDQTLCDMFEILIRRVNESIASTPMCDDIHQEAVRILDRIPDRRARRRRKEKSRRAEKQREMSCSSPARDTAADAERAQAQTNEAQPIRPTTQASDLTQNAAMNFNTSYLDGLFTNMGPALNDFNEEFSKEEFSKEEFNNEESNIEGFSIEEFNDMFNEGCSNEKSCFP